MVLFFPCLAFPPQLGQLSELQLVEGESHFSKCNFAEGDLIFPSVILMVFMGVRERERNVVSTALHLSLGQDEFYNSEPRKSRVLKACPSRAGRSTPSSQKTHPFYLE